MSDDVLTMLARKNVKLDKPAGSDTSAWLDQLVRANEQVRKAEAHTQAVVEQAMRDREAHQVELGAMRAQVQALTGDCAHWKAKAESASAAPGPVQVRYETNPADESLKSEIADLRVRCATAEARCAEQERTMEVLRAKPMEAEREAPEMMEHTEAAPTNYDIDVMRGGDDRIRSLRVRVSNT